MKLKTTFCGALLGLLPLLAPGQRLMWERTILHPAYPGSEVLGDMVVQGNNLLVNGGGTPPNTGGCQATVRSFTQLYDFAGTLQHEHNGRGLHQFEQYMVPARGAGAWITGRGYQCQPGSLSAQQRPYAQRLTATGDTLAGWWLTPALPRATATVSILQGRRLLTAGIVSPPGRVRIVSLTCSDTTGQVLWSQSYVRPLDNDYAIGLVATPRKGYLISGDAQVAPGFKHYLVETDSLGNLRRQVTFLPLGPTLVSGSRYNYQCNVIALPNAQGYLLSGTADSLLPGQFTASKQVGYVVRLDTSLNVVWRYRHPVALAGTGARSNNAYRIRLLPNNTVGLLLTEVRNNGTPDAFLAQVDVQTGQRVGFYTMSSNTQSVVIPYDWHWLGDGTLALCGKSNQVGNNYGTGYLARWDFRATPLAARSAAAARATATFYAFPNPSSGPIVFHWQLPPGQRAGAVRLYSLLGQLVQTVPLPGVAEGQQEIAGLAAGLYVARLVDSDGRGQGRAVRLVVE